MKRRSGQNMYVCCHPVALINLQFNLQTVITLPYYTSSKVSILNFSHNGAEKRHWVQPGETASVVLERGNAEYLFHTEQVLLIGQMYVFMFFTQHWAGRLDQGDRFYPESSCQTGVDSPYITHCYVSKRKKKQRLE